MAERKEEAYGNRVLPLLHQLSSHVVDRRDMIRIYGMPQAKGVGKKSSSKQHWLVMECQKSPNPGTNVHAAQKTVDSQNPIPKAGCGQFGHEFSLLQKLTKVLRRGELSPAVAEVRWQVLNRPIANVTG